LKLDADKRCDEWGSFGAFDLGESERKLCEECYRGWGSCCPEFGKNDLWSREE
jgi:hypothetical protein